MAFDWALVGKWACYSDISNEYKKEIKTVRQWALKGFVPIDENSGREFWSNHNCNGRFKYFHISEVKEAVNGELDAFRAERNAKARERRRERKLALMRLEEERIASRIAAEKDRLFREARERYVAECRKAAEAKAMFDLPVSDVIVLDTETTGLKVSRDELLQISILDGNNGGVLFNSYVRPVLKTEWREAMAVNHITPELVADAPDILSLLPVLNYIVRHAKVLIAYNGEFDMNFMKEFGVDFSSIESVIDVMQEFAVIYGDWNNHHKNFKWKSLTVCADYFGYEWSGNGAHDSCEDCKATLFCYNQMRDPKYSEIYERNLELANEWYEEDNDSRYY